jgi:hypothetical protein
MSDRLVSSEHSKALHSRSSLETLDLSKWLDDSCHQWVVISINRGNADCPRVAVSRFCGTPAGVAQRRHKEGLFTSRFHVTLRMSDEDRAVKADLEGQRRRLNSPTETICMYRLSTSTMVAISFNQMRYTTGSRVAVFRDKGR